MLNLYPRLSASSRYSDGDADGNNDVARYRAFYGIAVACVAILLFCVLAATVGAWKAGAFAVAVASLLVVLGCFAPRTSWVRRGTGRPVSPVLALTARSGGRPGAPGRCARAHVVDAPAAFAYVCPLEAGDSDAELAAPSCVMCPVCLEDIHGGEMVRQLPACKHVFHVECIDMWLDSHRTCPMCRCVISPPPLRMTAKASEPEEAPQSSDERLPPV
ncbi:hypothetical protein ZWY2020_002731 [Hordeum vulgare]|uniref:RING-type E3 ubiquitin transferase n=1 Tax=Hordeum vulgare subsp. vulgare TaxID=112509 RepID=A0A8I6YGQ8_HORVV|nr:hypothetical protein ZWY2020_002731 [Hordeum vulgare]